MLDANMGFKNNLTDYFQTAKRLLKESSFESILCIVDAVPTLVGFSIRKEKVKATYWIMHLFLMFYIYGVGSLVYQTWYAQDAIDYIKSNVNISILVLTYNNSYWWLTKRPLIREVIEMAKKHDEMIKSSRFLQKKSERSLLIIKIIVFLFYGTNYFNAATLYVRHRVTLNNDFAMVPCVGIQPLTSSPNREICATLLTIQEINIMICVFNYQCLLILLIAHTAITYHLLADEMMTFNTEETDVKEKLPAIISRHILILDIVSHLKSLYSIPFGVNFATNAVCMAFFFYLPLEEWLRFLPIVIYCFLVFFLYCFLGQRIVNGAEVFERAVYSCGWERFGVKERKMVYIMLILAQQKVELLAADITPVNIYTFATTMQGLFKFVTVVKI